MKESQLPPTVDSNGLNYNSGDKHDLWLGIGMIYKEKHYASDIVPNFGLWIDA